MYIIFVSFSLVFKTFVRLLTKTQNINPNTGQISPQKSNPQCNATLSTTQLIVIQNNLKLKPQTIDLNYNMFNRKNTLKMCNTRATKLNKYFTDILKNFSFVIMFLAE